MYTIQSLIKKMKANSQYPVTFIHSNLCPESVKNVIRSVGVEPYADVVYLLNPDDTDRLLNILETLE